MCHASPECDPFLLPGSDLQIAIYTQVSQGFTPVIGAKVVAVVTHENYVLHRDLWDSGTGLCFVSFCNDFSLSRFVG